MKVTATHELKKKMDQTGSIQGNNNQGNKEETESTKNSAIPLVLPYSQLYLADIFDDPLQPKKERGKAKRIRIQKGKRKSCTNKIFFF